MQSSGRWSGSAPADGVPPSWHALFAPLPADAVPRRQPVGTPEVLATPTGAAIAGWDQIVIDLSAGGAGLRVVHLVLDGDGRVISASDMVLYRSPEAGPDDPATVEIRQESVGGGSRQTDPSAGPVGWPSDPSPRPMRRRTGS